MHFKLASCFVMKNDVMILIPREMMEGFSNDPLTSSGYFNIWETTTRLNYFMKMLLVMLSVPPPVFMVYHFKR